MTNLSEKSDEFLMGEIAKENEQAFSVLYDRYARTMLNYFYKMLGLDQTKAEDFLQELFLKLWQKAFQFKREERLVTWLYTIAHNMCRNEYRRVKIRADAIKFGRVGTESSEHDAGGTIDFNLDSERIRTELHRELGSMDEAHRSVFLLRYHAGLSIAEIGKLVDCAPGTVKSRLHYTIKDLEYKLKEFNPYS